MDIFVHVAQLVVPMSYRTQIRLVFNTFTNYVAYDFGMGKYYLWAVNLVSI